MAKNNGSNLDKVREWIGEGKVQILGTRQREGKLEICYRDDNFNVGVFECIDEEERREVIDAFGGQNFTTVALNGQYLYLNGWSSEELGKEGYLVAEMSMRATWTKKESNKDIKIPKDCGYKYYPGTIKKNEPWVVTEKGALTRDVVVHGKFGGPAIFKRFLGFCNNKWPEEKGWKKLINQMVVHKIKTHDVTAWQRGQVRTASKEMELLCVGLNGRDWKQCFPNDIIIATEGIAQYVCHKEYGESKEHATMVCRLQEPLR